MDHAAMNLWDRRVVVMGMSRSGQHAARLARDLGARVLCTDLRGDLAELQGMDHVYGEHREQDFRSADIVVVSPGIPARSPFVQAALDAGVLVLGELAFAHAVLQRSPVPVVAVTGTNGKSSVCSFVGQLLAQAGKRPFVGGNIGRPLSILARERTCWGREGSAQVAVVEVSSYQMELPGRFSAQAGAILNLTPDHLARHGTMEIYAAHKLRIFDHCGPASFALLPPGEPRLPAEAVERGGEGPKVLWIGGEPGARVEGDRVVLSGTPQEGVLPIGDTMLFGEHNKLNLAAAALLATCAEARLTALDASQIRPLEHRLELVRDVDGVAWINDSKATNVDAALAGITGVGRPLVALLGGEGKEGADYAPLAPALAHARKVVCFGASGDEIARALGGLPVAMAAGLTEAVEIARAAVRPGDAVLLSPACASFDEFEDYEHRGRRFAALAGDAGDHR